MLTPAQITALGNDIAANTATAPGTTGQIKDLPHTQDNAFQVALWYNLFPAVDYWLWNKSVNLDDVYGATSDIPSEFDFATYKAQSVAEQNTWMQIFRGSVGNMTRKNYRTGVWEVFHANAAANALRAHIFALSRRKATNAEKLLATALAADANSGNDGVAGNRGKTTNPDFPAFDGTISADDIRAIWNI